MKVEERLIKLMEQQAFYDENKPAEYSTRVNQSRSVVSGMFEEMGYKSHNLTTENPRTGKFTSCVVYESGKSAIALQGHADVMHISEEAWRRSGHNPYGEIREGNVYGRGTSDMKGSLAALLDAIAECPSRPVVLVTFDEEIGHITNFDGIGKGLEFLRKEELVPNFVLNMDATGLKLIIGRKGMMKCTLKLFGKAEHGSTPDLGVNAIYKACRAIAVIRGYAENQLRFRSDEYLGYRTLNVGKIKGGSAVNTVPEECVVEFESRLLPGESGEKEYAEIVSVLLGRDFRPYDATSTSKQGDFTLELDAWRPAYVVRNAKESAYVRSLQEDLDKNGLSSRYEIETGFSEMNIIGTSQFPLECVALGVGVEEAAHADDENVPIRQLKKGSQIYRDFIREFPA